MPAAGIQAKPVYLIDASIYIFQAHFSPYVECFSSRGDDLSAVYGFTRFLLQFLQRTRAEHVAVAHDESLFCGFRHELCPNYKSNRELPDENLARQLKAAFEVCQILGLQAYASRRYEADDIIGVLSRSLRQGEKTLPVQIVTRDKDLAQLLLAEQDSLWDYQGNRIRRRADIHEELGIYPEQIPDYLGLVGDAVDCIGGVPGIGPVKARLLLQEYETLDGVYDNLSAIKTMPWRGASRLADTLAAHQGEAELSKRLATIVCELPGHSESFAACDFQRLARQQPDIQSLEHFFCELHFDSDISTRLMRLAEPLSSGWQS